MSNFEYEFCGLLLDVSATYQPEEPMTHDYPGAPAYFEIDNVTYKGEVMELEDVFVHKSGRGLVEVYDDMNEAFLDESIS